MDCVEFVWAIVEVKWTHVVNGLVQSDLHTSWNGERVNSVVPTELRQVVHCPFGTGIIREALCHSLLTNTIVNACRRIFLDDPQRCCLIMCEFLVATIWSSDCPSITVVQVVNEDISNDICTNLDR